MRVSKLTDKDMTELEEQDSPKDQVQQTFGALRDYSGQHSIKMYWDISDEAKKDMIFKMTIDDYEVLIDAEQLRRYLRWV